MNYLTDVRKPLIEAFLDVVGSTYPIQYENAAFVKPENAPYLAVFFATNDTTPASLGDDGQNETDGYLQIDLNWLPETGEFDQAELISELSDEFVIGRRFLVDDVETKILSFKSVPGRKIDNYWRMSASIGWQSYSKRIV